MFENIDGTSNSQGDIILGEDIQDLERVRLSCCLLESKTSVLESLRKHGLELRKSKCRFSKSKIVFLRHRVISTYIFPGERKVKAIIDVTYLISSDFSMRLSRAALIGGRCLKKGGTFFKVKEFSYVNPQNFLIFSFLIAIK